MKNFQDVDRALDRMNEKLDLILELVTAQKEQDWKRVNEVCKKLDIQKRVKVLSD